MAGKFYYDRLAVLESYVMRYFDILRANDDIKSIRHLEHRLFGRVRSAWNFMQFQGVLTKILLKVVLLSLHMLPISFCFFPSFGKSSIQFLP